MGCFCSFCAKTSFPSSAPFLLMCYFSRPHLCESRSWLPCFQKAEKKEECPWNSCFLRNATCGIQVFSPAFSLQLRLIVGRKISYSNQKTVTKTAMPRERGGSEFQSYHIIKFQCPVFHKKSPGIQRNRKVWPIQYKNIIK